MASKSVLSNVDLIKRFVFENQPVTTDQIVDEIMRQMASVKDVDQARKRYVLPVLKSQPYYKEHAGEWTIINDEMPEYKVLVEVMADTHKLMYEREIRSKIASKLNKKVMAMVIDLSQAQQLKQIGSHWALKDWELANDQAEEVLVLSPGGLTEKEILKHIVERFGLEAKNTILNLKGDKKKRFIQDRKLWFLKELYEERKQAKKEPAATLPSLKEASIDKLLEGSFLNAQAGRLETQKLDAAKQGKARLKKALKKQAQDILEQREDLQPKPEDLAAKLSKVLSAAGVDEYGVESFQRVEPASKDRGLSPKEREEIQQFIDQLLSQETVGVGAPLQSVVNAPLSARKMQDVLRLKYLNYTLDRAIIPNEYYRFLIEVLNPTINDLFLHPSCFEGNLAVGLFSYLFDKLDGAAWALVDDGTTLEIVQPDNTRFRLSSEDQQLIELARDKFIVTQLDLVNHFLSYRYTGIEADKVLARSGRVITRLSGFENAYIVSRDYLSELPEIFGMQPNETNEIPYLFDFIVGNFTFAQDPNLTANYLDQSLGLMSAGGRMGVFLLQEVLVLLKEHALLGELFKDNAISHFIKLPVIEGRHKIVLLIVEAPLTSGEPKPQIITAEIRDFKTANNLSNALLKPEEESELFSIVDQLALGNIIG